MIEYVNTRLNEWARWRLTGRQALFARPSVYFRAGADAFGREPPAGASIVPIDDLEAERTHRCVMALEPLLQDTVTEFYCRAGTAETMAKQLRCDKATLYRRIDRAHQLLLGFMNDVACGIHVEPWHELERVASARVPRSATGRRRG